MRPKKQKPPICIGGSEKLRAMDRPRYMNVPSPAPCHVNVAGVEKQSVWGLRIIARTQLSLWHYSVNSSMAKSGGRGGVAGAETVWSCAEDKWVARYPTRAAYLEGLVAQPRCG
jgi:hypothetical protein